MSIGAKITRLLAAAKEFNVGRETLVVFLKGEGFDIDDTKQNPRITAEMYEALQGEYAQDKAVKRKSDSIELPKGSLLDSHNKSKEDLSPSAKDKKIKKTQPSVVEPPVEKTIVPTEETKKSTEKEKVVEEVVKDKEEIKEETPVEQIVEKESKPEETKITAEKPIAPIEEKPAEEKEAKVEATPKQEEKKEEKEEKKEEHTPEKEIVPEKETTKETPEKTISSETPKEKTEKVDTKPKEKESTPEIKQKEEEHTQVEKEKENEKEEEKEDIQHIELKSPKLEGPKILDKINLDALNLSTRPKKGAPAQKTPVKKTAETPKPVSKPEEKKTVLKKADPKTEDKPKVDKPKVDTPPKITIKAADPSTAAGEEIPREHIAMNAPKLEGPRVVGKIELPVSQKQDRNEKRKRKRIPVDKKPETGTAKPGTPRSGSTTPARRGPAPARRGAPGQQAGGGQRNAPRRGPGGAQPNRRGKTTPNVPQEIDAKEIQDKIRETQAKLAGGGARNRNLKARYRRNKRDELADKRAAAEAQEGTNVIQVTEFISVSEFANLLDVSFADVISKCMNLGIMVSINQRLDAEVIELVASEFDTEVEFINLEDGESEEIEEVDAEEDLENRAPIVTIMGHVDHGKTSLLDYIRNATVVAGEAGGITQHIGAYRVTTETGKNLTFLDTPGHEAFTAMRARGAKVADVAIIVVAADDAIMPQTREAISHAQAANLPMVFAINKIDKEAANPEKIKEQLSAMNILVEDWGGKFQSQEISAKKGINIDLLLEKVLLESELLELKANPNREASGSIIEAELDKGRGYVSTVLVQNGELKAGDLIVSGQYYGKVRAMTNERGNRVKSAGPSTPVQVLGLNGAPQAGERFKVFADEGEAKNLATHRAQIMREQGLRSRKHITLDEIGRRLALGNFKELNVIIKADYDGSAEALSDSLQKLSTDEIVVNVVLKGVGQITESDVNLASASDAIIIGFQVRPSIQASRLAETENIEIRNYSIIYDAIAELKSAMEGMLEPKFEKKIVGNIEVRETYKISSLGTIAGCYVLDGKFTRNTHINIIRDGIVIHTGELASLKRFKDDVKEVNAGFECGLSIKGFNDIKPGDIIEGFEDVEIKRKL